MTTIATIDQSGSSISRSSVRGQSLAILAVAQIFCTHAARVVPALIATLIGLAIVVSGLATPLDQGLRNLRDGIRGTSASGEIHLIEIDARSLAAIDRWPWPRSVHARAVDALHAAGARTIAFDVDFSANSTPAEDARFAQALRGAGGRVVLPTFRQSASGQSAHSIDNLPIPAFRQSAFLAAVTIVPDRDGLVRTAPVALKTAQSLRPSLGAMVAEMNIGQNSFFPIDFAIDPATLPRHSFIDLIEGRVDPAILKDKRVLIGATAVEMGDRYAVPRFGVVPGAVIQALAAETLLKGVIPRSLGPELPFVIAVMALAALARWQLRTGFLVVACGTGLIVFGPLLTQALWATEFAVGAGLVTIVVGLLMTGAQAALAAYVSRIVHNGATGLPNLAALAFANRGAKDRLIAVAQIGNAATLASALDADAMTDLCCVVADRLTLSSNGALVHQVDEAAFAWTIEPCDDGDLGERFDALTAIFLMPVEAGGRRVDVNITFGLSGGDVVRQVVANAGLAASQAYKSGRRWQRFIEGGDDADWQVGMLGELDAAIDNGELFLTYQPKYDLRTARITSAEALIRWQHPTRGLIPPDDFILFAENGGRIERLTRFVLDTALAEMAGTGLGVAVNISSSLLTDRIIVATTREALERSDVTPGLLTLEVTESAAMQSTERAVAILNELKLLGVRISIDDYGTGQSTLSYLKQLPASEIKIDKSFVQAMLESRSDAILVSSTINLAQELGLEIVAEGVEDQACLDRLAELGCSYAQGYFVGRPMSRDALVALAAAPSIALAA